MMFGKSGSSARFLVAAALIGLAGCGGGSNSSSGATVLVQNYITGISFPSALKFAPDGRLFFTELSTGNIRIVDSGSLVTTPFASISVGTNGEQGLLGLAFDPDFTNNHYVYAFYTLPSETTQRVVRFTEVAGVGTAMTTIVDNIPASTNHNGGRIGFASDGTLFVTVGDNLDPANAQNPAVLTGKVLRYNSDGSIPADNPTAGSPVFTMGHRNPFGLAFYPNTGTPYVSENGPNCDDEINRLVPGGNYGWRPSQPCGDTDPLYRQPTRRYSSIIAPTGITFYSGSAFPAFEGDMLMTSYGDGALRRLTIVDSGTGSVTSEQTLTSGLGHVLDVAVGPDGFIYFLTQDSIKRMVPLQ